MSKKEEKHMGQRQLDGVTEFEEAAEDRPRGMPPLSEIKAATAKLGLPDSDAEHLYDVWLMSGFKTSRGNRIASWRAAIRLWHRAGYFPSQKKDQGEMTNAFLEKLARSGAYKTLDVYKEARSFKEWCDANNRRPLVTAFVNLLNSRL